MNKAKIRAFIRETIEKLDGNKPINKLFNYHTTQNEKYKGALGLEFAERKYGDYVIDRLVHIIMEEEQISEKSFSLVDEAVSRAKSTILTSEDILSIVDECHKNNFRPQYCAEKIFSLKK